jgi:hypothetical protein
MECLAAYGAAVGLLGPFPEAFVVQHVAADFDLCYIIVVDALGAVFLVWVGEECIGILNGEAFVFVLGQLLCCRS